MPHPRLRRQSLHLSIDPLPCKKAQRSPDDSSESSSWSSVRPGSAHTPNSSESSLVPGIMFSVLCLYDFSTNDPDQLAFRKNEILDIITKEDNGWWAAMRRNGDKIGWIPMAFVTFLAPDTANKLRNVVEELRIFEYQAEQLYERAPVHYTPNIFDLKSRTPPAQDSSQLGLATPWQEPVKGYPPPSPQTLAPRYNKPTPPTPLATDDLLLSPLGRYESPKSSHSNTDKIERILGVKINDTASLPWFLQPTYGDQLKFDGELHLRAGTLRALVERLTSELIVRDTVRMAEETHFRNVFLTTFRTFTKATVLFELLVERFRIKCPPDLVPSEFEEWKERKQQPTQRTVLTVFTAWLEDHHLLEEEPYIAQRLTDFLKSLSTHPYAATANGIVRAIERITFADPNARNAISKVPKPSRRSKQHKGELLKLEPTDIARELCLIEHRLYCKIRPQECLNWIKAQKGKTVENLSSFLETMDKLSAWVKMSILKNETLSRRADTVDFWIKVAEKCRVMNNFSSMSAITSALNSTVVDRLHLTWAHVGRTSTLEGLLKYNDPSGGFASCRQLVQSISEGPCVPFLLMLLTDIMHINDQFSDELVTIASNGSPLSTTVHPQTSILNISSSASSTSTKDPSKPNNLNNDPNALRDVMINFTQRQRWYEVVSFMLRFQNRAYDFVEKSEIKSFIGNHLKSAMGQDQNWFWKKSQEVQSSELAHADIRKGLERAGF